MSISILKSLVVKQITANGAQPKLKVDFEGYGG